MAITSVVVDMHCIIINANSALKLTCGDCGEWCVLVLWVVVVVVVVGGGGERCLCAALLPALAGTPLKPHFVE